VKAFGLKAYNIDFFVYLGERGFPIDISRDCIGWKSAYSLFALVIASPGLLKDKLRFLAVGVPVMLLVNLFRLFSSIFAGFVFGFGVMEFVHTVIWQNLVVLIIVGVWYIYIRKSYLKR
jgi:exosortase/archaeosortase family protein